MEPCSLHGGPLLGKVQAEGHGRVTNAWVALQVVLNLSLNSSTWCGLLFWDIRSGRCLVPSAQVLQPHSVDEAGWTVPTPSHSEPQASQKTCVLEAFNKEIWIEQRNEEVGM